MVKIKDIPVEERPIERLILKGSEYLSNEELLAILFKTGTKNISSKDLGVNLLSSVGDITNLKDITFEKLINIKGIGNSKAAILLAALELSKRVNVEKKSLYHEKISSPEIIYRYFKDIIGNKKQECFYVVYLDSSKVVIENKLLFVGTINYSLVNPREVFKAEYLNGATSIICVHNHPTGNIFPSKNDIEITNNLVEIGKLHLINVIDHIIIGKDNYYSFLENKDI